MLTSFKFFRFNFDVDSVYNLLAIFKSRSFQYISVVIILICFFNLCSLMTVVSSRLAKPSCGPRDFFPLFNISHFSFA